MTISQQIAKSLRTGSQTSNESEDDKFDIDQHLQSASQKILLERVNFVAAKFPYHFNLKQLKSKYITLNPRQAESSSESTSGMPPASKTESTSTAVHDGIPTPKMVLFSADSVELSWRNAMRVGAGLFNLGNTCFLNSSLQCLTYTAPLANYLIHLDHQRNCRSNGQFCMLCAMQQHLKNSRSHSGQSIKPMHILQNLRMIAKHLQFGRQEDAHEFIRYSVDAMQRACLVGYSSKLDVHVKATTPVHQIFGGYLRSRVRCTQCKSVSDTFDPFLDLSLEINKQGCCSLQHCLDMFVRIEVLQGDNAYKCMRCKNTVTACKKFSIHRAPNILMLQLKRFSNFLGNKINKGLSYPPKLNLAPYMSNKQSGGLWYELYAVLVHSGFSCQSGHYYSYAKAPNGQWHCFNDSSVYQVGVGQALNQQAYLLFYSRSKKAQNVQLKNGHTVVLNGKSKVPEEKVDAPQRKAKELAEKSPNTIIGPQLPPELKRKKDMSQPTTSNSGASAPKQMKQVNESPKKALNGLTNGTRSVSFTLNRKPKLIVDTSSKIVGKVKTTGSSASQSIGVVIKAKPASSEKSSAAINGKAKTKENSCNGDRTSILNQLLHDSATNGSSSAAQKRPATSALQALHAYSSSDSESDDEAKVVPKRKSGYSTLTSTLATLRKNEAGISDRSPRRSDSITGHDSGSKSVKSNGPIKSATERASNSDNSSSENSQTNSEREPILHVLSSEMKSGNVDVQENGDRNSKCKGSKDKSDLKDRSSGSNVFVKEHKRKRHHSDELNSTTSKVCKTSSKPSTGSDKSLKTASRRHSDDQDMSHVKEKPYPSSVLQKSHLQDKSHSANKEIDKLFRDKKEYEQSMRKKAKKDKRMRIENLQMLQNCIEEDDSSEDCNQEKAMPEKKMPAPAERPNVLGQLLKQSSAKAYGAKVSSWDGFSSVVENDAKRTWVKMKAPVVDDWNKEYDKGKVKKVKKENRQKEANSSNIFQKFQNFKNDKKQ